MNKLQLGINIDHIATIRNARGENHPDLLKAALIAESSGADNITVHLREDRRHIKDEDVIELLKNITIPINLEIAATYEMIDFALEHLPKSCCFVPEKREEITTEGGLNLKKNLKHFKSSVGLLQKEGIRVSLFIDPEIQNIDLAQEVGADAIEIHTGPYSNAIHSVDIEKEIKKIEICSIEAKKLGLDVHAGHGLNFENVALIASVPQVSELSIGHFIIGNSIFFGLKETIFTMREIIDSARKSIIKQ